MKKKVDTDYPYGLSLTLCGLGVLLYAYFAFMGLDYHYEGNLLFPTLLTLVGVAVLVWCLKQMCRLKRERQWRRGISKEIGFTVLALTVLALGSIPMSCFMHVYDQREEMQAAVSETVTAIREMDSSYRSYVDNRICRYDSVLQIQKFGTKEYNKVIGKERNKKERIRVLKENLLGRLMPEGFDSVMTNRNIWLTQLDDISIWNLYAPKNIKAIGETGQRWGNELAALSEVRFYGEEVPTFTVSRLTNKMRRYEAEYTRYCWPDWRSYAVMLFCVLLISLPYLMARRSKTGSDGTHK